MLMTGGDGRLGSELQRLLPGIRCPGWPQELDITNLASVEEVLDRYQPEIVIHAAAYTNVAGAEQQREACWATNVTGTRHIVQAAAARGMFLVHISTDYVFDGTRGMYREDDPLGPTRNYYALTKLVAEELARFAPRHLVIRTSFRPREWPYSTAFVDVWTSQDYVDIIAAEIALAISHCREIPESTLHIATERKSVYELARRRKPDVLAAGKRDAGVELPDDISLDISRWQRISHAWRTL
ncbi:MAG: SDR family oxidoreductase [Armatimonadota bacterium]